MDFSKANVLPEPLRSDVKKFTADFAIQIYQRKPIYPYQFTEISEQLKGNYGDELGKEGFDAFADLMSQLCNGLKTNV